MSNEISDRLVPEEIAGAFYEEGMVSEERLSGGIINVTLLITDVGGNKSILQRLNPVFDSTMADDYAVIAGHLRQQEWEVPEARLASSRIPYVADKQANLWRSFTFIESDSAVPTITSESCVALSGLLGGLHYSLGRLDYQPRFRLSHFHDTAYFTNKLEGLYRQLPSFDLRSFALECMDKARKLSLDDKNAQLIHGDPKITNALYRGGAPFTFIDYDTMMLANPLIDLGDMLRSITGKLASSNPDFKADDLESVIAAYYEQARLNNSEKSFTQLALKAGQLIALELGIRYLIDSVEDAYFDWDSGQFESRKEHNIARARTQWLTFEALHF